MSSEAMHRAFDEARAADPTTAHYWPSFAEGYAAAEAQIRQALEVAARRYHDTYPHTSPFAECVVRACVVAREIMDAARGDGP